MDSSSIVTSFFLIFTGAAVLASLALVTRQPLLIAYIVLGAAIGPYGAGWVTDLNLMADISQIGIMFLLFLLGLDMQPSALLHTMRSSTWVAVTSCLVFAVIGFLISWNYGFSTVESVVIGAAMMFSSTIIGIKLLPTTVLHHRHAGELMIGLLLLQDVVAIFVLLAINSFSTGSFELSDFAETIAAMPLLILLALLAVRWVLLPLITRFDRFQEYIFLLAIGWCLGMAELAHQVGLSGEIGAFIAGICLATSPISQFIAVSLKPLRDFFLILFFFSLGARFNLGLLGDIILQAWFLAIIMLSVKPLVFRWLLRGQSESDHLALDIGFRLGQISEFSLLIAYLAAGAAIISTEASHLIQATAIITFVVSSYIVVLYYPSPIAISDKLRRD